MPHHVSNRAACNSSYESAIQNPNIESQLPTFSFALSAHGDPQFRPLDTAVNSAYAKTHHCV